MNTAHMNERGTPISQLDFSKPPSQQLSGLLNNNQKTSGGMDLEPIHATARRGPLPIDNAPPPAPSNQQNRPPQLPPNNGSGPPPAMRTSVPSMDEQQYLAQRPPPVVAEQRIPPQIPAQHTIQMPPNVQQSNMQQNAQQQQPPPPFGKMPQESYQNEPNGQDRQMSEPFVVGPVEASSVKSFLSAYQLDWKTIAIIFAAAFATHMPFVRSAVESFLFSTVSNSIIFQILLPVILSALTVVCYFGLRLLIF